MLERLIAVIGLIAAFASANVIAQSVVKPTGNPPKFPAAYKELADQQKPPSNNWLNDANDDKERFRRLQVVMSGTDMSMWEISRRFEELHLAIQRENWEMGVYHWEKIRDRLNAAAMKRPARTQNLENMFLSNGVWQSMHDALTSKDPQRMRAQFAKTREACMACHVAERVGFLNDNLVFGRTASFPPLQPTIHSSR